MPFFYFQVEASATYVTTAPTMEVLVDGFVVDSAFVTSHTGSGTDTFTFLLEYTGGNMPSSLSLRFNDGSGEGGRSIDFQTIRINGQSVNPAYIGAASIINGQSSAINTTATEHLFGRTEPTTGDYDPPTQSGTGGDDRIEGTNNPTPDIIDAGNGADRILGLDGDDAIFGGDGNDTIYGGADNDVLVGGAGNDILDGDGGDDILHGGIGNDVLIGGAGNDVLNGGAGNDTLRGDAGDDLIFGEDGDDRIIGGAGNDYIYADDGNDVVVGGLGADTIHGGLGNDQLLGHGDDDIIYGEGGNNQLLGGSGNDTLYAHTTGTYTPGVPAVTDTPVDADFTSDESGFVYADGTFGAGGNDRVSGSHITSDGNNANGALEIYFDGGNGGNARTDLSGSYDYTFNLANDTTSVVLDFAYRAAGQNFDAGELLSVMVDFQGSQSTITTVGPGTYDTGWITTTVSLGDLTAGNYTLKIGGYLTQANRNNEDAVVRIDDVTVTGDVTSAIEEDYDAGGGEGTVNYVSGDANNDTIYGSRGTDTLIGGSGDDIVYSSSVISAGIAAILDANPEAILALDGRVFHAYTSTGAHTFTAPTGISEVDYLVVGGGGGGGGMPSGNTGGTGGGGAGGVLQLQDYAVIAGNSYAVTVGAGGAAGVGSSSQGGTGGSSDFDGITALGGGGGASSGVSNNGVSGASGGGGRLNGSGASGTQGNDGGDGAGGTASTAGAGGGGGAGSNGSNGSGNIGGDGGDGVLSDITGTNAYFGGGGAGGSYNGEVGGAGGLGGGGGSPDTRAAGFDGIDGFGGGGGGASGSNGSGAFDGGTGGDGIVIVAYDMGVQEITTLSGGAGNDDLYGSQGIDIFKFSEVGTANLDTVHGFNTQADKIDLSDLLSGYDPLTEAITDFVQITDSGTDSDLRVDTTGTGSFGASTVVATFENVTGLTNESLLEAFGVLIVS